MKNSYQTNLDKVKFLKRVEYYRNILEILRENVLDVIKLRDKKKMSFEAIAIELGLSSKSAAYNTYKANKPDYEQIKKYRIKKK